MRPSVCTSLSAVALTIALVAATGCASSGPGLAGPGPFPNAPARRWADPAPPGDAGTVQGVLDLASTLRGVPYRFGGSDPRTGFDCSGFVRYVFGRFDVQVPRTAAEQFHVGHRVDRDELAAGDLVFFTTIGPGPTHVGIVVDPDTRTFVHAPGTGSRVRVERFDTSYWSRRMLGIRRLAVGDAGA